MAEPQRAVPHSEFVLIESPDDNLDPITVSFVDYKPGAGQVIITCYGSAWTAFFGAMGECTIREFFMETGADYLENKLTDYTIKTPKRHTAWLRRIIHAIKAHLSTQERETKPQ